METETKPGDVISTDDHGRIRVSRIIPLPWLIGGVASTIIAAASTYYGQQQTAEAVKSLQSEMRALSLAVQAGAQADVIHVYKLTEIERRLGAMESNDVRRAK